MDTSLRKSSRKAVALPVFLAALALLGLRSAWEVFVPTSTTRTPSKIARRFNVLDIKWPKMPEYRGAGNDPEEEKEENTDAAGDDLEDGTRVVEVSMPLGIDFEEKGGGDIYIKAVEKSSDAWAQGVRPGAQLVSVSATFGDEMWNTRNVGLTQFSTVINSRFGSTMKLALQKEDQNVISAFMEAFTSKKEAETEEQAAAKQASLEAEFERTEKDLEKKEMWNPFR
eukprot:TRINITY_DN111557_c1_g1_i1.p1 TRINITY_DN111557_c1_g1~~TRINITY_DN111557_c1_g1_i1.p1  ORF type:complete len:226 (-),score=81.30 TRINITY_DN111557_c1_g1_i1:85-762(-)